MERWHPKREATRQEQFILKRLKKKRKLFGFLRNHWHEIFDDDFQAELDLLLAPSIKAALDRDWSDPVQKAAAVKTLVVRAAGRATPTE